MILSRRSPSAAVWKRRMMIRPEMRLVHNNLSKSASSAATKSHGKRRRLPTVKDRLRSRTTTGTKRMLIADEELIAERMVTRLEWAQQSLTAFWRNPSASTSSSGAKSITAQRPPRYDLVMNSNWWFWNLLLAASPSLALAAYCEWVAKPQMQRLWGDDNGDTATHKNSVSVWDAWSLLLDWWQGKLPSSSDKMTVPQLQDSIAHGNMSTAQSPPTSSTTNPHLQQLQQLKRQMEQLEAELLASQNESTSGTSSRQSDPSISPMQQRRLERQQKQEQQPQQAPKGVSTAVSVDTSDAGSGVDLKDTEGDGSTAIGSGVSSVWGVLVQALKTTYTKSKDLLSRTSPSDDDDNDDKAQRVVTTSSGTAEYQQEASATPGKP